MMQVKVKQASIDQVKRMLIQLGANVRKEIAVVINKTAKQVRIPASRELGKILPVPSATLKKTIGQKRKANDRRLEAIVIMRDGYDFPLRFFVKKATKSKNPTKGITVQLDKRLKGKAGRTNFPNAFIVHKFKGDVFLRSGKKRNPIKKQFSGITPGQAFKDANIASLLEREIRAELPKQLNKRLEYLLKDFRGELRGNQSKRKR
jgi:hypothetical protein